MRNSHEAITQVLESNLKLLQMSKHSTEKEKELITYSVIIGLKNMVESILGSSQIAKS
ncbi:MAG: hypothetical protein H8D80_01475 [Proteobacteria bacterium]|nr:hypothetical protein [Pseudomonadota bacterium]